jgi:tryptophan synthase alpha chain
MKSVDFIPFIVVGDPSLEFSERAVDVLIENGASLIELGVPYSDALADGPVIQAASERASKSVSLDHVLKFTQKMAGKHKDFPFVIFTYFNPILKMGLKEFARRAAESKVYAVLVVDLPPEESTDYRAALEEQKIKAVFLASPTTPLERVEKVAQCSTAFIYYVSRTGVTGEQKSVSSTLAAEIKQLRSVTDRKIAIGFGISNAAQAKEVALLGDAVVVGSAFVRITSERKSDSAALEQIASLAKSMSAAIAES